MLLKNKSFFMNGNDGIYVVMYSVDHYYVNVAVLLEDFTHLGYFATPLSLVAHTPKCVNSVCTVMPRSPSGRLGF